MENNFAVKLTLGRTHYPKQYDIYEYLVDYSARGGWSTLRVPESQDWWMDVMFGYTTILFNEYEAYRRFMTWFDIRTDFRLFELNAEGEYVMVKEVDDLSDIERERNYRQRSEVLVVAIVGKDMTNVWWNSPNKAFDGKTPEVEWSINYERVYSYLMGNTSCDYS